MNDKDDGTQKYNNHLTMWLLWTFLGIVFFIFIYYSHEDKGTLSSQNELKPEDLSMQIQVADLQSANTLYQTRCSVCHGNALQGGSGPNLTDTHWIQGKGTAPDIINVLKVGVLEKGMPAWGTLLEEKKLVQLTALILAKQDSNPPGAKAPQGIKTR